MDNKEKIATETTIRNQPFSTTETLLHAPEANAIRIFLKVKYGLAIDLGSQSKTDQREHGGGDAILLKEIQSEKAGEVLRRLKTEIEKYPPTYLRYCAVKGIRLAESIKRRHAGTGDEIPESGHITDDGLLYLATDGRVSLERVLHHELSHSADDADKTPKTLRQRIKSILGDSPYYIDEWIELYKNSYLGEENRQGTNRDDSEKETLGFANNAGRTNSLEDRATIAECVMTDPNTLFKRGNTDTVLREKVEKVIANFRRRTNGLMDRAYFNDLANGKVDSQYWNTRLNYS